MNQKFFRKRTILQTSYLFPTSMVWPDEVFGDIIISLEKAERRGAGFRNIFL